MKKTHRNLILLSIVVISVFQHWNHFSKELISIHVWRQTQTQSTIINFYEEDMNILNPRRNERGSGDGIFRMEFPLMQWIGASLYKVFGNHLIIIRIFMFVVGLLSILGLYVLLNALFKNEIIALIGAWTFNFSPSFYYYTINPLPDNFALCSSIWGLAMFFMWQINTKRYYLVLSGLLLSIGALCKLPFILYFVVPGVYFLMEVYKKGLPKKTVLDGLAIFSFVLLPFAWYATVIPQWENGIVAGVLDNKASFLTILDYCQHNLFSTLPELLLNYGSLLFFLSGFYFLVKNKLYKSEKFPLFFLWGIAVLAYFFFEINMIEKVHDYYLFPFYPMLFVLVSYGAYSLLQTKHKLLQGLTILLLLALPLTAYLRMHHRWDPTEPGFNKDLYDYRVDLKNVVPKDALVIVGNDISHFIYLYYLDKKGWVFNDDTISAIKLKGAIAEGAQYLYSDSRVLEESESVKNLLGDMVLEKGSIRVYKLKPVNDNL